VTIAANIVIFCQWIEGSLMMINWNFTQFSFKTGFTSLKRETRDRRPHKPSQMHGIPHYFKTSAWYGLSIGKIYVQIFFTDIINSYTSTEHLFSYFTRNDRQITPVYMLPRSHCHRWSKKGNHRWFEGSVCGDRIVTVWWPECSPTPTCQDLYLCLRITPSYKFKKA
jgi:hypothetical protein